MAFSPLYERCSLECRRGPFVPYQFVRVADGVWGLIVVVCGWERGSEMPANDGVEEAPGSDAICCARADRVLVLPMWPAVAVGRIAFPFSPLKSSRAIDPRMNCSTRRAGHVFVTVPPSRARHLRGLIACSSARYRCHVSRGRARSQRERLISGQPKLHHRPLRPTSITFRLQRPFRHSPSPLRP